MATIISGSDLLRRAVQYIAEERAGGQDKPLRVLVDEAAMRFNLSPLDSDTLVRILQEEKDKEKGDTPGV